MTGALTRADALNRGLRFYSTPDKPCKRGHTGKRYAVTGNCVQCTRDGETKARDKARRRLGIPKRKPGRQPGAKMSYAFRRTMEKAITELRRQQREDRAQYNRDIGLTDG